MLLVVDDFDITTLCPMLIDVTSTTALSWQVPWTIIFVPTVLVYMAAVSMLRYQRATNLQKRYNFTTRASFHTMSTDDAHAILKDLTELEFPKIFGFSIIFALFKGGSLFSLRSAFE